MIDKVSPPKSGDEEEAQRALRERNLKTIPGTLPSFGFDALEELRRSGHSGAMVAASTARVSPIPKPSNAAPPSIKVSPLSSGPPMISPKTLPPMVAPSATGVGLTAVAPEESIIPSITGEFFTDELLSERYQLIKKIGQGGMGAVFLATDTRLNREIVVKVSHGKGNGPSTEDKARFEREALKMASLNHPNIVTIYDYGTHSGDQFLVMEHVKGETLKSFINHPEPISLQLFREIVKQLLRGVQDAHIHDVIHRDLKPSNIMWDGEKKVLKILDFGLARGVEGDTVTGTGHVHGSIQYMAPEQIRGESQGPPTDIYAVGILCFQLLSKLLPFRGENTVELMFQKLQRDPYQLLDQEKLPTWVNRTLAEVIHSCLLLAPSERPQSASDCLFKILQALPSESHLEASGDDEFSKEQQTSITSEGLGTKQHTTLPSSGLINTYFKVSPPLILGGVFLNLMMWLIVSFMFLGEDGNELDVRALVHFSALDTLTGIESEVELSVNGSPKGMTPLRLELPLGQHEVSLKRDEWSYSKIYDLKKGGDYWYHLPAPPMSVVDIPQPIENLDDQPMIIERPRTFEDSNRAKPSVEQILEPSQSRIQSIERSSMVNKTRTRKPKNTRTTKRSTSRPKPRTSKKPNRTSRVKTKTNVSKDRPKSDPPNIGKRKSTIDVPLLED